MFVIPTADALVNYIKDFTGSTNDAEVKQCIFLGELSMRNVELPALRSDPYDPQYIGVVDENGSIPIPGDMNKPILFFKQGTQYITTATCLGISGGTRLTLTSTPSQSLVNGMFVTGTGIAVDATIQSTNSTITATGTGTISTDTITISNPNGYIIAGMSVAGTGISAGAVVVSVVGSTVTLTQNNSGAVSGTITFSSATAGQIVALDLACTAAVNGTIVFQTPPNNSQNQNSTGPWIVYDRIGDRDIITQGMIAQLYLQPVNVPAVIRGKFSEVGQKYKFLPYVAEGDLINMYYYKSWPLLFAPIADILISAVGTVGTISGAGTSLNPYLAHITGMTTTAGMEAGQTITATAGSGSIGGGIIEVYQVVSDTEIIFSVVGATSPTAGTITDIKITSLTTQTNPVLQTWPEGYVYSTLREYYIKRHNEVDAQLYEAKFQAALATVEDQNNLGKWSGGHTRLTSVWQPRQYRQYNIK